MSDDTATLDDALHGKPRAAQPRRAGKGLFRSWTARRPAVEAHDPSMELAQSDVLTAPQLASLLADRASGYRLLEDGIRLATMLRPQLEGGHRSITVAGLQTRAGSAEVLAGIGVAIKVMQNRRTVLVDCDTASPSLHKLFRVSQARGMLTALGGKDQAPWVQPTPLMGLSVLACEQTNGSAVGPWLETAAAARLLALGGPDGLTLLSAPPLLADPISLTLASRTDGTILVVPSKSCRRATLAEATRLLDRVGARVLGVVMTNDGR